MAVASLTGEEVPAASLRERKNRATRGALRRSAVALVASRGLAAVNVDDIAANANVSTRTFYNYFPSKEDAISGWDPAVVADMVERLRGRPTGEAAPAALRAALSEVFALFDNDHRDLLERLRVTRADPHLLAHHVARWAETERQLIATLVERRGNDAVDDRYASLVVATMLTASRVALMSWCDKEGAVPLAEELAFHFDVLGAGLAEPERNVP
jgi:AcrR family transcriptional regulator